MVGIAVPVTRTAPPILERGFDVVEYADYLLTTLCDSAPSRLHAEWSGEQGHARCVLFSGPSHRAEFEVGLFTNLGLFRSLLARIGSKYMEAQFYGGRQETELFQGGTAFDCVIQMANSTREGYRVRIDVAFKGCLEVRDADRPSPGASP
jgi:hypothetical protein